MPSMLPDFFYICCAISLIEIPLAGFVRWVWEWYHRRAGVLAEGTPLSRWWKCQTSKLMLGSYLYVFPTTELRNKQLNIITTTNRIFYAFFYMHSLDRPFAIFEIFHSKFRKDSSHRNLGLPIFRFPSTLPSKQFFTTALVDLVIFSFHPSARLLMITWIDISAICTYV